MIKFILLFLSINMAMCFFIPDEINSPQPYDKVCYGTNMGFSYSGTLRRHFRAMQRRYADCTYISGNLEITHLRQRNLDYDLSFLKNIRYVSGYVLIAMITEVREIPLINLEIIRGNRTVELFGRDFALTVTMTTRSAKSRRGLQELQMPKLREITNGNVFFSENPALCYAQTIMWEAIINGGKPAMLKGNKPMARRCMPCSYTCRSRGGRRCWGRGKQMCQIVDIANLAKCHPACPFRCYGPGIDGCCHSQCAGGCFDDSDTDCQMCRDYVDEDRCVGSCGDGTYPAGQVCQKLELNDLLYK